MDKRDLFSVYSDGIQIKDIVNTTLSSTSKPDLDIGNDSSYI